MEDNKKKRVVKKNYRTKRISKMSGNVPKWKEAPTSNKPKEQPTYKGEKVTTTKLEVKNK